MTEVVYKVKNINDLNVPTKMQLRGYKNIHSLSSEEIRKIIWIKSVAKTDL